MEALINQWLQSISAIITSNIWLAPFLAFIAGILTSFTPCSLTSVPLIIGYVGGTRQYSAKKAFRLSVVFSLGMALTFTILGIVASMLGRLLHGTGSWWYIFIGTLMLLMALQTWEIYDFIPSSNIMVSSKERGVLGALLAGVLGGFFASPCATPVLVVLLTMVAKKGNLLWGILLLLLYSIGHSFLVVAAGTSFGFVQRLSTNERYGIVSNLLKFFMGVAIVVIAFYMFYLGF